MPERTLIRGGYVLTLDPETGDVPAVTCCSRTAVFVAGRAVKRDGEPVGVDLDRGLRLVEESRDYLLDKAGLRPEWLSAQPVQAH